MKKAAPKAQRGKSVMKKTTPATKTPATKKVGNTMLIPNMGGSSRSMIPNMQGMSAKNGGSLTGLDASKKRMGPVDPKGAFTKVQKKTLSGSKGTASLTKDKELGATKMAKKGMNISKKK
jgi:hypothetical protein